MKTNKHISLDEIGNQLPFTVPDNYFANFEQSLQLQIAAQTAKKRPIIFRRWMYAAAMFIGVMVIGQVIYSSSQKKTYAKNAENYELYIMSQVDEASMVDYYVENSTKK